MAKTPLPAVAEVKPFESSELASLAKQAFTSKGSLPEAWAYPGNGVFAVENDGRGDATPDFGSNYKHSQSTWRSAYFTSRINW